MSVFSPFNALVELWRRYERPLSAGSLIIGFTFDLFVAKRPDSVFDNILLLSYLFIAGAFIIILNIHINRRGEEEHTAIPIILLLVLQFCFGGLASNLLILYGRSGTFAGSALFFFILAGMLIGNEFLQTRYAHLRFNIVVYYFLLLTYCVIAVPTFIFHSVGNWIFLASGIISLVAIGIFLSLVYVVVLRGREREAQIYEVSVLVGLVFLLFNGLYFLQIIPPVPLSLKDIGIYHSLTRLTSAEAGGTESIYSASYERAPWWEFWRSISATYTVFSSGQAACFSSVFAPGNLSASIFHRWEKYDEGAGKWRTQARISFDISGGRDAGYRGFTLGNVSPGRWRCDVETQNGALIGRTTFTVASASSTPDLSTKTL
jgi:hypothetical protein